MSKTFSFLVLSSILFLLSCAKEESKETGGNTGQNFSPTNNFTADSSYIDSYYSLYDIGAGIDTMEATTISYDNLKRITHIRTLDVSVTPNTLREDFQYSYAGTDTLPVKTIHFIDYDPQNTNEETFHYYDAQRKKIKDSAFSTEMSSGLIFTSTYVTNYSYGSANIYSQSRQTGLTPSVYTNLYKDTSFLDGAGNVLLNRGYTFNGVTYDLTNVSNYTYDSKPFPFGKRSDFYAHYAKPNEGLFFLGFYSFNNRLTDDQALSGDHVSYSYSYNSAGRPVKISALYNGDVEAYLLRYKVL